MKQVNEQDEGTRGRLLEAASKLFAEKGYHNATIAQICAQAGANVAAVNYYFRHKEDLYVEAFRRAFLLSIEAHPPDGGVGPEAPAQERFHGRILSLMHRVLDPDNLEFDIVHKEMANPTGLLNEVMHECVEPIRRGFADVVRELLGPHAPEAQVVLCQASVEAQCFHHTVPARRSGCSHMKRPHPGMPADLSVEALAGHLTRFSLAGIREVRRRVESGEPGNME